MANDTHPTNPLPTYTPIAAPAVPASSAPDLSALTSPASQPPTLTDAVSSNLAPLNQASQEAGEQIKKINAQPTVPPNAPHAKLLAMVNALAIGLSSFGTAVATHGEKGGAQEVAEIQGEQQNQKIQAQQAAQAQKNAKIQQQLTIIDTNQKLAQNVLFMATLPNTLTESDFKAKSEKLGVLNASADLQTKALQDLIQTGNYDAYQKLMGQLGDITGGATGTAVAGGGAAANAPATAGGATAAPAAPSTGIPPAAMTSWKNSVDAASLAYPNDPQIKQYGDVLADSNASPMQLAQAANGAKNRMAALDAATESRTKQNVAQAGSVYAKLSTPEALAAPGAQASIQAAIDNPNTPSDQIMPLMDLIPQAYAAQANADAIKKRQAEADEAVKEGDPNAAGKLLAGRQTTISELKSRGMTPQFITQSINAALKIDPNYNAVAEDNFAKTAGSEQNQQFFGNVGSLIAAGGTLDQLAEISKGLSQSDIQALNKVKNWAELQVGVGGISATAAKAVGVADDYAKVMGAGVGSDASRAMVLHIIDPALSPDQRSQSIQAMKDAVKSQADARIGNNPWMKVEYGSLANPGGNTGAGNGTNLLPGAVVPPGKTIPAGASPIYGTNNAVLGYKDVDGKYVKF